ncbi:DUF6077 domain-containing protein [Floccifex sp.]|uniref:DUF6077 domain-containing protein n=1 Tax=Floccifex sp. TaxID=2815810 RepID=UPI002A757B9E|nr:DUF6077 domain-containing protein [Floccifex sp.]MDD7281957.1 DUF6077 domain-containing protein [Erysipelotrichaceae bacterium]MDY2957852.1 DUF6077 domain-containing protein [Floccifex sp.]
MNWILTFIFYFFLFFQYALSGEFILSLFGYEKTSGKRIIAGFLCTFFITFLVGFPCQLFFTSFNTYFIIQILVFIIFDMILIIHYRNRISRFFEYKEYKTINYKEILKNNWVCILLVVLFTTFSMSSQLSIYQLNYDDIYYVTKINNLKNAAHLMDTDFFNGRLLDSLNFDLVRTINTYELSYAFLSTISHIETIFFCRVTMVIHNYVLFTLVIKEFASFLVNKNHQQYALLIFFLFLIPCGYLQEGLPLPLHVYSYDLWQFQTAMFYGGSVVRMMALPILYIFSEPLVKKMEFKKIIWLGLLSIVMMSFSTIYIQLLILFFIVILVIKLLTIIISNIKESKLKTSAAMLAIILIVLLMFATKYLDHFSFIKTDSFVSNFNSFMQFELNWYSRDLILKLGIVIILLGFIFSKQWNKKRLYLLCIGLYLLIYNAFFSEFLLVTSVGYFFVILRSISSIQYLVLILCCCSVIQLFERFNIKNIIYNLISVLYIGCILVFFTLNQNVFTQYDFLASGISGDGWDFSRVVDFDTPMTATIFDEVGSYFDTLPEESYKLFCPEAIVTDGIDSYNYGFVMSSDKIQIHNRNGFDVLNDQELTYLTDFSLYGQGDVNAVKELCSKEGISYILVFNSQAKDYLSSSYELILENTENINPYYLFKIQ